MWNAQRSRAEPGWLSTGPGRALRDGYTLPWQDPGMEARVRLRPQKVYSGEAVGPYIPNPKALPWTRSSTAEGWGLRAWARYPAAGSSPGYLGKLPGPHLTRDDSTAARWGTVEKLCARIWSSHYTGTIPRTRVAPASPFPKWMCWV